MPGRFANLEFREERNGEETTRGRPAAGLLDEHHYLVAAHEEYRWGRFEKALRFYTRCLEQNRAMVPAWVGQVQMLVQLGEYHEARLWSDKALELFRDNGDLLAAKAQACVRLKDHAAAMVCSDGSMQAPGSSPWRWQARGEVLLARGREHFDACFRKSLDEPAADWFDRVVIARIYRHYQKASNALYYLREAMQMEPTCGYIWFEMGHCQAALGLTGPARSSYDRCLELRGDYGEAREALAALDRMSFFTWLRRILRLRIGP